MRTILFNVTSWAFATLITLTQGLAEAICWVYGNTGSFLLRRIDSTKLDAYNVLAESMASEPEDQFGNLELKLLSGATQVRDHAKETGDWTDDHTEAIMAIGNALVAEMGWEEDYVHQYLREVVESIDGLEYGVED